MIALTSGLPQIPDFHRGIFEQLVFPQVVRLGFAGEMYIDLSGEYTPKPPNIKELRTFLRWFTRATVKDIERRGVDSVLLYYERGWFSDCFILLEQYQDALDFFPETELGARATLSADCVLSLRLAVGDHIKAIDILSIYGPQVTEFGKDHLEEIRDYIDVILEQQRSEEGVDHLADWVAQMSAGTYPTFSGSLYGYGLGEWVTLPCYRFSNGEQCKQIRPFVKSITRQAENVVREEMDIPLVGEGWISETNLYYQLKRALPEHKIQHHASPKWLGRQHIDIFLPEINVGVEYQGSQHDQPIEYFGGQEAFERTKKRDIRKKQMCTRNGVRLIRVRPGYDLPSLVEEISVTNCAKTATDGGRRI